MKIFVTLGTQDKAFDRLVKIAKDIKGHDVFLQNGYTHCDDSIKHVAYLNQEDFDEKIDMADIVITHGGVGSILNCLKKDKITIVCPRLAKYKEHTNDHQLEIVERFSKDGYIIALGENGDINEVITKAQGFKPRSFISNQANFIKKLDDYISSQ